MRTEVGATPVENSFKKLNRITTAYPAFYLEIYPKERKTETQTGT